MALIPNKSTVDPVSSSWANLLRDQTVQVTTSAARPSSPTEGMTIWETDTNRLMVYNGTAWYQLNGDDAWTAFTPTVSGNGGTTATLNANESKWCRRGRLVHARYAFRMGSVPSGSPIEITLPTPAVALSAAFDFSWTQPIGWFMYGDRSSGQAYPGRARLESSTIMRISTLASPIVDWSTVTGTPVVWASGAQGTGDELVGNVTYEPVT